MNITRIENKSEYDEIMNYIEILLQKSTQGENFESLSNLESQTLQELSLLAEQYEDMILLMPLAKK